MTALGFAACPDCEHAQHEHEAPYGCSRCGCDVSYWGARRRREDGAMTNLSEFLLARISEDEAEARGHDPRAGYDQDWSEDHRAHVLADCNAKRRIVEWFSGSDPDDQPAMRMLALPYAGHPDYRAEWHL